MIVDKLHVYQGSKSSCFIAARVIGAHEALHFFLDFTYVKL